MTILIYGANARENEALARSLRENDKSVKIGYRNPHYFNEIEGADQVYVLGDFPAIVAAYGDKVVTETKKETQKKSAKKEKDAE